MKKTLIAFLAAATMLFCGCEKDNITPNDDNNGNDPSAIDLEPYLGKYLMTRKADLTINVLNMFQFPLSRDLNVEIVTVAEDPTQENGIIMTSNDGMYLRGVVDTLGLHLENDTIAFAIDTMGVNASISVTMVHPIIAPRSNGALDWTSTASGTASSTLPIIGPVNVTLTGNLHYHSVLN